MAYLYIHPGQNVTVKLFLLDADGSYVKWPTGPVFTNNQNARCMGTVCDGGLALKVSPRHPNTCRETLCNSLYEFMNRYPFLWGHNVTLKPPSTKSGRPLVKETSAFILNVGGSVDGKHVKVNVPGGQEAFVKAYSLCTTKKSMVEVYGLMDVIMGTAALLLGGPTAYTRSLVSRNKVEWAIPQKVVKKVRGPNTTYDHFTGRYLNMVDVENKVASAKMVYTGVSNFWMIHPALYSVMSGLSRQCLELWFDGKYEEIDDEIGISSVRRWLAQMAKKKEFSPKDKKELEEVLSWFKSYFNSRKVGNNLGAYPINKYTYGMFIKLSNKQYADSPTKARQYWQGISRDSYGNPSYGFYTWCKNQKEKTSKFEKRNLTKGWGGLSGQRVAFGGHRG